MTASPARLTASFALLTAGCANQLPPYVPPVDGPIATIRFLNQSTATPITVLFYEDGIACKRMRRLSFYSVGLSESSVKVRAAQPFTFTIDHSTTRKYCRQTFTFTPSGSEYRVRTVAGMEECSLVVERSDNGVDQPKSWSPVTGLIRREYSAPFFEDGEWCTPLESSPNTIAK